MECLPVTTLPQGPQWVYELKLDGYRAQAIFDARGLRLLSRNGNDLSKKYPRVVEVYVARVPAGFVPATRRELFKELERLRIDECPFVNLPQSGAGRWGQGFTAEKMKKCVWVRPKIVAQFEFLEWTDAEHVRHIKFIRVRDDKLPSDVTRET